jgi:hypothetical protein
MMGIAQSVPAIKVKITLPSIVYCNSVILNMENCLYGILLDDGIICQILQNFRELPVSECVQAQAILILSNYK